MQNNLIKVKAISSRDIEIGAELVISLQTPALTFIDEGHIGYTTSLAICPVTKITPVDEDNIVLTIKNLTNNETTHEVIKLTDDAAYMIVDLEEQLKEIETKEVKDISKPVKTKTKDKEDTRKVMLG